MKKLRLTLPISKHILGGQNQPSVVHYLAAASSQPASACVKFAAVIASFLGRVQITSLTSPLLSDDADDVFMLRYNGRWRRGGLRNRCLENYKE